MTFENVILLFYSIKNPRSTEEQTVICNFRKAERQISIFDAPLKKAGIPSPFS